MNDENAPLMSDKERAIESLHPRVLKLAAKGKPFIVIGCHEPYFREAYDMIECQERRQGTWTRADALAKEQALSDAAREKK